MRSPKERLSNLLELAAQGEGARAQLAQEISDVLLGWPPEYPQSARPPFETLLEKTLRDVDRPTRVAIAARFARRADTAVALLNQLFFAATPEMKDEIVARNNEDEISAGDPAGIDEDSLLAVARNAGGRFSAGLAHALGIASDTADEILRDRSGQALAIACKGARTGRATFSALAVLCDRSRAAEDSYLRLASFDAVPQGAAERMLAFWRAQNSPIAA
jgi:hypothetical protein